MGTIVVRQRGHVTYEATDVNLAGGNIVIASTTTPTIAAQGVKLGTDAAINVVGVALTDAMTAANLLAATSFTGAAPGAYAFTDLSVPGPTLVVAEDEIVPVVFTAVAVAYGVAICAAASGQVRAWVSGTDAPAARIGRCMQPGGVSSGGGVGLALVRIA